MILVMSSQNASTDERKNTTVCHTMCDTMPPPNKGLLAGALVLFIMGIVVLLVGNGWLNKRASGV